MGRKASATLIGEHVAPALEERFAPKDPGRLLLCLIFSFVFFWFLLVFFSKCLEKKGGKTVCGQK